MGNLITLCPTCYALFNLSLPALIIIPTDLNLFLQWERDDYDKRCQAARNGEEVPPRSVPTEPDYNGMYRAYPLNSTAYPGRVFPEKAWSGSPPAMILKSSLGLSQPVIDHGSNPNERYPSQDQRTLMTTLMNLYSRPAPEASEGDDKGAGKRVEEEEEEERSPGPKRRRTGTHQPASTTAQKTRRSNPPRKSHLSGPYKQFKIDVDAPWTLGPWMSTNDTLNAMGVRHHLNRPTLQTAPHCKAIIILSSLFFLHLPCRLPYPPFLFIVFLD
jgi:hypothetical protein